MPFPLSIDGTVAFPAKVIPEGIDLPTRLRDALLAETLDNVRLEDHLVSFRIKLKLSPSVARAGGQWWLFALFDRGEFTVHQGREATIFTYRLSTRFAFYAVTALAIIAGAAIRLSEGPAHWAGYIFGLGLWLVMFLSQYFSKTIEIRRWVRTVALSHIMPSPKSLRRDEPC